MKEMMAVWLLGEKKPGSSIVCGLRCWLVRSRGVFCGESFADALVALRDWPAGDNPSVPATAADTRDVS